MSPTIHSHIPEDQNPLCDFCGNIRSPKYLVFLEGKLTLCPGLVLYVPLKCWRRQTQQHTVTSQKTRILCVTAVETSGLPSTLHFLKEK